LKQSSGAAPLSSVQGQHRIVEEDSNDYEDDEYLTQSPGEEDESLVKPLPPGESRVEDDEDIDIEKLDFNERALLARINSLKRYLPEKY